ncbi:small cysteine and glycine repeat-containing protein 2-like [Macrobrachium nipponense]|uniref:small cysteine and glycine repeat-containing protein 2-like n=1 Tax=Macrobrachium nipponense TaxID=159736 RepID=UPI0030C7B590
MKGLQVLFVCCLAASASAQNNQGNQGNTRFLGGLLGGLGGGLNNALGGAFGGGFNPGFGGGVNPGFGGGFGHGGFGGGGFGGVSQTCRRWCRTPEGQAYCCESNNEPDTLPFVKPGICPPVRPQCPPVRNFAPPQTCSNDSKCGGIDKCCYDRCLEEHVCKPPVGSGGGFGFGR